VTRAQLEAEARRRVGQLSPEGQELVGVRVFRRRVWSWTNISMKQLYAVLGACVVVRLIHEETP
jgi:hypothetical protein